MSQSDEARRDHLVVQELTDAMTRRELAAALERLSFTDGYSLIKVDPGVREFLLRAVRIGLPNPMKSADSPASA